MTEPIIAPTVGRILHYFLHDPADTSLPRFNTQGNDRPDPLAAMIVGVHSVDHVNLVVYDANGVAHCREAVPLVQGKGAAYPADRGHCEWMPYQKGQAAKTEAAEAKLIADSNRPSPAMREDLVRTLVSAASHTLAGTPSMGKQLAQGIKDFLDELQAPGVPAPVAVQAQPSMISLPVIDRVTDSLNLAPPATLTKVTPADIDAEIVAEYSVTLDQALQGCPVVEGLDRVTVAVLVLKNGTKLVGVNYGAIDPANHSAEIGRSEARAAAIDQAWPLLGFRLRDLLAAG